MDASECFPTSTVWIGSLVVQCGVQHALFDANESAWSRLPVAYGARLAILDDELVMLVPTTSGLATEVFSHEPG